ncbi:hypothetical protein ACJX0J_029342, partial [Zea mays]
FHYFVRDLFCDTRKKEPTTKMKKMSNNLLVIFMNYLFSIFSLSYVISNCFFMNYVIFCLVILKISKLAIILYCHIHDLLVTT